MSITISSSPAHNIGPLIGPVVVLALAVMAATLLMLRLTQQARWQQEYSADDYATDLVGIGGLTWLATEPPVRRLTRRITTHPDSRTRLTRQRVRAPRTDA